MKFKNMKRFGSAVMAGALAMSLAVPALAADDNTTKVEGGYQATPISVLVPSAGTATINPYGLPVAIAAKADGDLISITDQQITNIPMYITNYGTVGLDVNATLLVKPLGDVSIKGAALAPATDKGKEMNVTLEVAGLDDHSLAVATDDEGLELAIFEKFADEATWEGLTATNKVTAPAYAKGATTAPAAAKSTATLATLGAATVSGETITYGDKSIALFRLVGEMNEDPLDGTDEDPWAAEDGFEATIVFKFKPTQKTAVTVVTTGATGLTDLAPATLKGFEGDEITFTFKGTSTKTYSGAVTGMTGTAPTVTINEQGTTGVFEGKFTMPNATAGITLTITGGT